MNAALRTAVPWLLCLGGFAAIGVLLAWRG